jgi:hypothetical protein
MKDSEFLNVAIDYVKSTHSGFSNERDVFHHINNLTNCQLIVLIEQATLWHDTQAHTKSTHG